MTNADVLSLGILSLSVALLLLLAYAYWLKTRVDEHKKTMAYLCGILLDLTYGHGVSEHERETLEEVATTLGYYDLDDDIFNG